MAIIAKSTEPLQETRERLLAAAIEIFGRRGYDGASIRQIASAAGVNLAGIAYHFGGKDLLYKSCLMHIVGTVLKTVQSRLPPESDPSAMSRDSARASLKSILAVMAETILATPRLASFARMIVREQMDPSPAFGILYESFMAPMHTRLCRLWSAATGEEADSEHIKLSVFAAVGQILVFRIARAGALKRMGWTDIGPHELSAITQQTDLMVDLLITGTQRGDIP